MGILSNFLLSTELDTKAKIVKCKDLTSYPITIGMTDYDRDELAVLLLWSNSSSTFDVSGVNVSNQGNIIPWTLNVNNTTRYWFRALACPFWNAATNYTTGSIVFHNGKFGITNDASIGEEPGTNGVTNWLVITSTPSTAIKLLIDTYLATDSYGYSETYIDVVYNKYKVENLGSYKYRITDQSGNSNVKTVAVKTFQDVAVLNTTISTTTNILDIDLSTYGDNAYIVTISDTDGTTNTEIIYEITSLETCYQSLFDSIMCSEDYGCDCGCVETNCDTGCGSVHNIDDKRHSLTLLTGFYFDIMNRINMERSMYVNFFTVSEQQRNIINDIGFAILNANLVVNRCGGCSTDLGCGCNTDTSYNQKHWSYYYNRN